jgi:hypothetical protein
MYFIISKLRVFAALNSPIQPCVFYTRSLVSTAFSNPRDSQRLAALQPNYQLVAETGCKQLPFLLGKLLQLQWLPTM